MHQNKGLLLCVLLGLLITSNLHAQQRESNPFITKKERTGAYLGITVNYTSLNVKDALVVGLRTQWVRNHRLSFGVAGYGFFNESSANPSLALRYQSSFYVAGVYGGFIVEPIIWAERPVHLTFPVLLGGGGVAYTGDYYYANYYEAYTEDADGFFLAEPGMEVEMKFTEYMRVALGMYYRFSTRVQLTSTDQYTGELIRLAKPGVMKGLSLGVTMKFGMF